ncbi:unnamed protein product, partial [Choristocarpus tenellus]
MPSPEDGDACSIGGEGLEDPTTELNQGDTIIGVTRSSGQIDGGSREGEEGVADNIASSCCGDSDDGDRSKDDDASEEHGEGSNIEILGENDRNGHHDDKVGKGKMQGGSEGRSTDATIAIGDSNIWGTEVDSDIIAKCTDGGNVGGVSSGGGGLEPADRVAQILEMVPVDMDMLRAMAWEKGGYQRMENMSWLPGSGEGYDQRRQDSPHWQRFHQFLLNAGAWNGDVMSSTKTCCHNNFLSFTRASSVGFE